MTRLSKRPALQAVLRRRKARAGTPRGTFEARHESMHGAGVRQETRLFKTSALNAVPRVRKVRAGKPPDKFDEKHSRADTPGKMKTQL